MGKHDIPVPKRSDEFASLENELVDAIANVDTRSRAVEEVLASFAEPEPVAEETPRNEEAGKTQKSQPLGELVQRAVEGGK